MGTYECETLYNLALNDLTPNPDQPRKVFSEAEINMLAESIKEKGLLQSILVKEMEDVKQQEENGGPPDFRGHGSVEQGRCVHDDSRGPHLRFVDQPEI
jgi:hypothetical protein